MYNVVQTLIEDLRTQVQTRAAATFHGMNLRMIQLQLRLDRLERGHTGRARLCALCDGRVAASGLCLSHYRAGRMRRSGS